jgi:hypothetical protein
VTDRLQDEYRDQMTAIANVLDRALGGAGFTLLVYDLNKPVNGRINFISNSNRADVITAMKEFIAQDEGRKMSEPEGKQ